MTCGSPSTFNPWVRRWALNACKLQGSQGIYQGPTLPSFRLPVPAAPRSTDRRSCCRKLTVQYTGAKKPIPRYAAAQLWWPRPRWWLTRFTNRRQLMAFSELFASEHISGGTRLRITKAGNEVAHVDQFRPRCRLYSVRHRGYGLFRLAKSSRQPGDTDHATPASHRRVAARLAP
jgi:hypothetical protein